MAESGSGTRGPPKKPRSDVWEHYELLEGQKKVLCLLCNPHKEISYQGGTVNLRDHLSSQHSSVYKTSTSDKAKQTTLLDYGKRSCCSEARAKDITNLIMNMIIFDMRPLRLVESTGFLQLMSFVEPSYKVPSAMHMSKLIHQKHGESQRKLKDLLEKDMSSISLTTDIWTSGSNEAYITVSGHFISQAWQLVAIVLTTSAFPERHTGLEISQKLVEIVKQFGIEEKVVCVVHDQASNMILSMDILLEDKEWSTLRCGAHCLQLCINSGLTSVSAIDRSVAAAKKLVGHFRHSVVASEALKERQQQMGIEQKRLIQSCVTRWSLCYEMLFRLLEMRLLSDESVTKRNDRYLDLKSEQWTIVEELVAVLKPLQVATPFLQYEHNSSVSCILPVINGLDLSLQPSSDDSPTIKQFKAKVHGEIRSRWYLNKLNVTSLDVLASAVDPRFKELKFLNDEQKSGVKEEIIRRISPLHQNPDVSNVTSQPSALDILLGPDEVINEFSTFQEEEDAYFCEKVISRDVNPLVWWKDNQLRFPNLV